MSLTQKQLKQLRKLAHHRKVIVIIGQHGLTDTVMDEVNNALAFHELVKVRLNTTDREQKNQLIDTIASQAHAEVVQRIGHVAVFYRQATEPRIAL